MMAFEIYVRTSKAQFAIGFIAKKQLKCIETVLLLHTYLPCSKKTIFHCVMNL